jgi:hypothetical protein
MAVQHNACGPRCVAESRDSSVRIVTRIRDRRPVDKVSIYHSVQTDSRAHIAAYPTVMVEGGLPLGVQRQGREAEHSPSPSAELMNAWSYASTPPYIFMVKDKVVLLLK